MSSLYSYKAIPVTLAGTVPDLGMLATGWYMACKLDTLTDRLYIIYKNNDHNSMTLSNAP